MWFVVPPSKYFLWRNGGTRYSGLQWVLHKWRLTGGVKQGKFCGEESFMSQAVLKIFIVFYEILWLMEFFIRLYFDQIYFSPHKCYTSYFFKLHFNIISLISTYFNITMNFLIQIRDKILFFLCAMTHIPIYNFDIQDSEFRKYIFML